MKGGAKGGGGVEIDLKTSSLSNGFNFPLATALWVFFPRKKIFHAYSVPSLKINSGRFLPRCIFPEHRS